MHNDVTSLMPARNAGLSGHRTGNFDSGRLLRPAFLAGIKPCDVIMHKAFCRKALKNISIHLRVGIKHGYGIPETEKGMKCGKKRKAHFPLGEFIRANSKKSRNCPTFSRRNFLLTNHISKICFSLRANKFVWWKMGLKLLHFEWGLHGI